MLTPLFLKRSAVLEVVNANIKVYTEKALSFVDDTHAAKRRILVCSRYLRDLRALKEKYPQAHLVAPTKYALLYDAFDSNASIILASAHLLDGGWRTDKVIDLCVLQPLRKSYAIQASARVTQACNCHIGYYEPPYDSIEIITKGHRPV